MERREQFIAKTNFAESCHYLQNNFFPKAKELGIGAWIQLLSPKIVTNETRRFAMKRILEKNMSLTIQIEENESHQVVVTILSSYIAAGLILRGIIFSIPTCGVAGLITALVVYVKYNRWQSNFQKSLELLKKDLC